MKNLREAYINKIELENKLEELRQSQEELETSRNKYAFLYDFAPVGYFTFDPDGMIRSVNLAGERLLGVPYLDQVDHNFVQFVAEEDRSLFTNFLRAVFAEQGKKTCRLRLSNCKPRPLSVRIEAMVSEAGDECLAVLVDITEKQRAEQALAESEYNLAKAQAMTHVGSWRYDPNSGAVQASDELLRILRLSPEQSTQEAFARVVHPEDRDNVIAHLQLGIRQGKSYEIEHRLQLPDFSERWVYSIVEPLISNTGEVLRVYGTTQDITERKRAEVELRNKTNELQAIFDSISDGIMVYDQEGRVQHHNLISPQFFPEETESGKACGEIFHPEVSSPSDECPVERALRGERVDMSLTCATDGRDTRYLDVTATPIRDELGAKNRALVFFRDVSEKRLQEMHLIQSEKMSSIGVLATGIAHEINNPLTSVAGFAEALLRRFRDEVVLQDDQRLDVFPRYLQMIISESYRCKGIIEHLLSFGRKADGTVAKVDLNLIVQEILELIKYQPGFQQIQVVTDLKQNLPRIIGDPSGLRQVCMNLLVNAHQAIDGPGRVDVTTERASDRTVALAIRDTGCGMAQQIIDRIWEPFFTTKEVGKGIGLGLSLTYNIVKNHGGDIHLTSREGQGSQFTVVLPIDQ